MPQRVGLGPERSNGKIRAAGTSGKSRVPQIAYRTQLLRRIGMARPWRWAAYSKVPGGYAWSRFRGRTGLIWGEGGRASVSPHACEKGPPRLRLRHRWDRARIRQACYADKRLGCVPPRPPRRRLAAFSWLTLGHHLPRLLLGVARHGTGTAHSPLPTAVRPSTQLGSRFDSSCRAPWHALLSETPAAGCRPVALKHGGRSPE